MDFKLRDWTTGTPLQTLPTLRLPDRTNIAQFMRDTLLAITPGYRFPGAGLTSGPLQTKTGALDTSIDQEITGRFTTLWSNVRGFITDPTTDYPTRWATLELLTACT